ncbi:hypothetical protein HUU05_26320 [candidate division KSB1 bacterium]|nr:hypothetical protein [candidate division KSB1 bacterium]
MKSRIRFLALAALILCPLALRAQYWSDYVLEKGFESRDYFLRPHRVLTLNLKNLDAGLLGILPEPLSEMSLQPAMLATINGSRFYVDLKGSAEKPKAPKYRVYPLYYYDNAYFAPPYYARPAERKLEPLVSALYVGDVAAKLLPGVKFALAYELIHHQGTFYEYVPYWYYGAYDAFGVRAEADRGFPELEPNLKQDGLDEKTETAHLFDAYLAFKPAKFLALGAKVSRVQTDISGDYVRFNDYDDDNYHYVSRYLNAKSVNAELEQNEVSAGALFTFARRQLGVFAGRVSGEHLQSANDVDSSFYSYEDDVRNDYFSRSRYSHFSASDWKHEGKTNYFGAHGELPMQNDMAFRFRVEHQNSEVDLFNGDAVQDTSFSFYRFRYYPDSLIYEADYGSRFSDDRHGEGAESVSRTDVAIGVVLPVRENSEFMIGLIGEFEESELLMDEDAEIYRSSHQRTPTPWQTPESRIGIEDKTLRLDRTSTTTRFVLPVTLSYYLGRGFTTHVAALKQFLHIETEEVIDIWYRTDSLIVITPSGTRPENPPQRLDRYRATPVRRSETSLHFRLGLSFEPSKRVRLDVGMGASPTDLETWQFAFLVSL